MKAMLEDDLALKTKRGKKLLHGVLKGLRSQFRVVGLTEQFDRSMRLFDAALPGSNFSMLSNQLGKVTHGSEAYNQEETAMTLMLRNDTKFQSLIRADLVIYREIEAMFRSQVRVYGVS